MTMARRIDFRMVDRALLAELSTLARALAATDWITTAHDAADFITRPWVYDEFYALWDACGRPTPPQVRSRSGGEVDTAWQAFAKALSVTCTQTRDRQDRPVPRTDFTR